MSYNQNNLTDTEILDNFKKSQDSKWLGLLLQQYTLLLYGLCLKYLKSENKAKDAVQQIFVKVIDEIPKYKITYFKSWLYMVAKNYCLMQLRDKKQFAEIDKFDIEQEEDLKIEELQKNEIEYDFLKLSLNELNPDQKQCINMFYYQKKSYHQIVEETNYSLMQVKSHIQNGKRNLKILIEKKRKQNNARHL